MIIITDGFAQDDIETPAWRAANRGIKIYAVGVGPDYDYRKLEELTAIHDDRIFTIPSYDNDTLDAKKETQDAVRNLVIQLKKEAQDACSLITGYTTSPSLSVGQLISTPGVGPSRSSSSTTN